MLKIEGLTKKYADRVILKNIDYEFGNTGLVFITGDSGMGKTTLLNILSLLDNKYDGNIYYDDVKINVKDSKSLLELRKDKIGFIFQDYNLIDYLTVHENLKLASSVQGKFISDEECKIISEKLKIDHIYNSKVRDLSGGEKQRVALGRSVAKGCEILFADEPTGNLDKDNSKIVFEILKSISKDKLVIVVSHNEEAAYEYGDCVLKLDDGILIEKKNGDIEIINNKKTGSMHTEDLYKRKSMLKINSLNMSFMKKNSKVYPVVVMTTLCMIVLGFFGSMFYIFNNLSNIVNQSILENDKFTIRNDYTEDAPDELDEKYVNSLMDEKNVKMCLPYYKEGVIVEGNKKKEGLLISYDVINDDPIFIDRYDDLKGSIPKNSNEIIIDSVTSNKFFGKKNAIGQKLNVITSCEMKYECKIVGIRESDEKQERTLIITKELSDKILTETVDAPMQTYEYVDYRNSDVSNVVSIHSSSKNNRKILYGREIRNSNEIVMSYDSLNAYLENMRIDIYYSEKEILDKKVDTKIIDKIFKEKIYLTGSGEIKLGKYKVVGIFVDDEETASIRFAMSDEDIKELRKARYNAVDIYVKSSLDKDMKDIINVAKKKGYLISTANGKMGTSIYAKLSMILWGIAALMVVAVIVCFVVIYYTNKNLVLDRTKEMGIIKSFGAGKKLIRRILINQNMIIWSISFIVSLIVVAGISKSKILRYNGVPLFSLNAYPVIASAMGGIIIMCFIACIESRKIESKSIVECMKN